MNFLNPNGRFSVEHWYRGKLLDFCRPHNDTTNEGKNRFLDINFNGVPQITALWIGLIDHTGYTAVAATDTYANINLAANGWDEFTGYTDTNNSDSAVTRPLWSPDEPVLGSIANTTKSIFTVTTAGAIEGLFVVGGSANAQTKSDNIASNSILWATALTGTYPVSIGSVLRMIYTVNA
jgi:hypothetical protein